MADAQSRSYASPSSSTHLFWSITKFTNHIGTYSGLETEAIVALALASICLTSFELLRRKRRKTKAYLAALAAGNGQELGSVESWEWG